MDAEEAKQYFEKKIESEGEIMDIEVAKKICTQLKKSFKTLYEDSVKNNYRQTVTLEYMYEYPAKDVFEAIQTLLQEFETYKRYFDCNVGINKYENYVSKDKIREKIEELDKFIEDVKLKFPQGYDCLNTYISAVEQKIALQELLGEGEENERD